MADSSISAPAPALVTTKVEQPRQSLADSRFAISDIQLLLGIVVALAVIGGFFLALSNRSAAKRKEDQDDSQKRTQSIMDAINKSGEGSARDLRELTDRVKEGRTIIDKDIEALRTDRRHDKANAETVANGLKSLIDRNATDLRDLHTRMTTQEEKTRNQDAAIGELKAVIREKIDETKALIKSQGEIHTEQFKELASTIREMSVRQPK